MKKNFWAPICILLASSFANLQADQVKATTQPTVSAPHHHQPVYGSFYTKEHFVVPAGYGIPFDRIAAISGHGIKHHDASSDIIINEQGVYLITYSVSLKECHGQIALELDGIKVPASEISVEDEDDLTTISFILNICSKNCCEHKIRLINNHEIDHDWFHHNVILHARNRDSVTASLVVERIADCEPSCCCK